MTLDEQIADAEARGREERMAAAGVPARYLKLAHEDRDESLPKGGLFITGPSGAGKTHLAVRIIRTHDGRFVNWPSLLFEWKLSFRSGGDAAIQRAMTAKRLVLDDLGSERPTDFAIDSANVMISNRYEGNLPTIITSNLTLPQIGRVYGDRIASRIAEMGKSVTLTGDWRLKR